MAFPQILAPGDLIENPLSQSVTFDSVYIISPFSPIPDWAKGHLFFNLGIVMLCLNRLARRREA